MSKPHDEEKLIKEFTEADMEIINKIAEEYSDDITITIKKINGEVDCNITFSNQSPNEIATFLYEIDKIGMRALLNLGLLLLKDRDPVIFSRIAKGYLAKIDRADRHELNKPIIRPSQVLSVTTNGQ